MLFLPEIRWFLLIANSIWTLLKLCNNDVKLSPALSIIPHNFLCRVRTSCHALLEGLNSIVSCVENPFFHLIMLVNRRTVLVYSSGSQPS